MNTRLRTVLVEDEPPARERLHALLAAHANVEIVGEAGDVDAAARLCATRAASTSSRGSTPSPRSFS